MGELDRVMECGNRIGSKFLHAGPGYGGSFLPKDTLALLKTAEDYDSATRIVEAAVKANDSRKRAMDRKVVVPWARVTSARACAHGLSVGGPVQLPPDKIIAAR